MAIRSIFELLDSEVEKLAKLRDREGEAWLIWKAIGERLKLNFNPEVGRIPSVERVGFRTIRVLYSQRQLDKRPINIF